LKVTILNSQQDKQKVRFDKKIKPVEFFIDDKVLYYNAAKAKQWSGKLNLKWKGPYYIHDVLISGSHKLRNLQGHVLITPVNGNLYYDRQNWQPIVIINNINTTSCKK
jgi:hypothetical protein